MTYAELEAKVREWDNISNGSPIATARYGQILAELIYHARREWRVYLPAEHPNFNPEYLDRLSAWIGNVTDEDEQKLLLEYALHISFFSHDDFAALYRTAFNREIAHWVAAQVGTSLELGGLTAFQDAINRGLHVTTWFCPITDSLDINEFYKVNHLKGIGHRPSFATLWMLAEKSGTPDPQLGKNLNDYMGNPGGTHPPLERLVLLEDVVGSGSQCIEALRWAVKELPVPILFVPLILCPNGVSMLRHEEQNSGGRLTVRPVIELERSDLLGPERKNQPAWTISDALEGLVARCASRLPNVDPFGYKSTGCSIATFANTPDNTLPIIHHKPSGGNWAALFPRVFRD